MIDSKMKEFITLSIILSTVFGGAISKKKINNFINNNELNKAGIKIEDTYYPKLSQVNTEKDFFEIPYYINNFENNDIIYIRLNKQTNKYKIVSIKKEYFPSFTLKLKKEEVDNEKLFMSLHDNSFINIVPIEKEIIKVQSRDNLKIKKYISYQEYKSSNNLSFKKINK